ncbi:MAG: thiamine ABC transporter substrate-binding protein [Bdellovibrio sp.]|nr:thiamine ABC transporter substrate-binding protein [Bdellovibrio sp.]
MKHFIIFIALIFSGLIIAFMNSNTNKVTTDNLVITVYASSSFVAKWGPGPALASLFEKQNNLKVEFVVSSDVSMTLQKISFEGKNSIADVVVGLDQFDLTRSAGKIKWKDITKNSSVSYSPEIEDLAKQQAFLAYNWAPMSFVTRQDLAVTVEKLDDLLKPELKGKIALQDPRTSSPGLQFLIWVFENKSMSDAKQFLKSLNQQVHSYSAGWSAAYGLFKNKQADIVFSYVTSPIYHLVEEKDPSYISLEFKEAHPLQIEFAGIPDSCKNCEGANKFVHFLQTTEAQKILMTKNYMLPIESKTKNSTAFDSIKVYKTKPFKVYDKVQLDDWIQIWSEVRKNEGF